MIVLALLALIGMGLAVVCFGAIVALSVLFSKLTKTKPKLKQKQKQPKLKD